MKDDLHSQLAESVGWRVLDWKSGEFLELVYMLEDGSILKCMRVYSSLSAETQERIVEFMNYLCHLENPVLRVDLSGLHIEAE